MMAARKPVAPVDMLPQLVNEVIVATAKGFRAARPDGKGSPADAAAAIEREIPVAVERFNATLDELECDILRAKAVLLRDLNQLRAKRKPPPPPEQKPNAPPAPTESPKVTTKGQFTGLPGPSKPVAPFPNMGFDATSPEAAPAPGPKTVPKPKEVKNAVRPAPLGAVASPSRPASAPSRKQSKVPPPQVPRPAGAATAPKTPVIPLVQGRPSIPPSTAAAPNVPAAAPPLAGHGKIFTEMTFSLAPPSGDTRAQKEAPQPPQNVPQQPPPQPGVDVPNLGAGNLPGFNMEQCTGTPAEMASMDIAGQGGKAGDSRNMANADAKADGLFDLGPAGMENIDLDYDLSGDGGEDSNFNDMYFGTADGGAGAGDFDDAYFNLNG